jgi:hypothetical protein
MYEKPLHRARSTNHCPRLTSSHPLHIITTLFAPPSSEETSSAVSSHCGTVSLESRPPLFKQSSSVFRPGAASIHTPLTRLLAELFAIS